MRLGVGAGVGIETGSVCREGGGLRVRVRGEGTRTSIQLREAVIHESGITSAIRGREDLEIKYGAILYAYPLPIIN